jgi:hypothetical protein
MTPQDFQTAYPSVLNWIRGTIADHEKNATTVAALQFKKLPLFFGDELLESTKVVAVDRVPVPPLSSFGLSRFTEFERGDFDGIAYLNTFFVKNSRANDESLHFHELIHVVQWAVLGAERFLEMYAEGLEKHGYRKSPLENMAYYAEAAFSNWDEVFDAKKFVTERLSGR